MAPALGRPPGDPELWWCYQRGLDAMHRFTRRGFAEAERLFHRALRLEPRFAPAHADFAYLTWQSSVYGYAGERQKPLSVALEAAQSAVALQPDDAEGHFMLGMIRRVRCEYRAALDAHARAVELQPTSPRGHFGLAVTRYGEGRLEDALGNVDTAIALGPRDPLLWTFLSVKAVTLEAAGHYEEAAAWAQRALRAPNATWLPQMTSVSALGHLRASARARRALDSLRARRPGFRCTTAREILSFLKPDLREHYVAGLRLAGLQ